MSSRLSIVCTRPYIGVYLLCVQPSGTVSREVQKDAVGLRFRVQGLWDVVRHDLGTGRRTGTGARVLSQQSGGGGGRVGHQRARAVRVLAWGRLWEDAGGVMLRLETEKTCRAVSISGLGVLAGRHGVCAEDSRDFRETN